MVKAIVEGRKTMTRRLVKRLDGTQWENSLLESGRWQEAIKCPYGVVGDRLWVKETWACLPHGGLIPVPVYRADGDHQVFDTIKKWSSPLFMPRWASRLILEITNVRVERLQEITEEDAIKEGIDIQKPYPEVGGQANVYSFSKLWDSLNGKKHPWSSNPFVWIIEFKRLP